ncbi:DNA repair protein [Streptococcus henryi]|nr:DNA repair protein [Streptococcus henryi]
MNQRDFRKLRRIDLYEIMLAQSQEIDALKVELAQVREELSNKEIKLKEAGSIAEAALSLTNIFEEAQKAADLYLENIKTTFGETDENEEE